MPAPGCCDFRSSNRGSRHRSGRAPDRGSILRAAASSLPRYAGRPPAASQTSACPRPRDSARRRAHRTMPRRAADRAGVPAHRPNRWWRSHRWARSAGACWVRKAGAPDWAKSPECRMRALALIDVQYDKLPAVATIDEALAEGAPLLFDTPVAGEPVKLGGGLISLKEPRPNVLCEFGYTHGDADAVLGRSDHVFEDCFHFSRINHFHLEPHVNIARVTGELIELWSCNQDPFVLRSDIARMFGRPANNIRIHTSYVGGGFGGKSFCKMEPLVVLLAMKAGRPVRLCLSLDESLLTLTKHAGILVLKTGVTKDGRLTARKSQIQLDGGAYSDASALTVVKTGYRITGPYRWDAVATRAYAVRTNTVPAGSFRGFGGTQASFASESQIDMIARRLGIDPYDFRCKNLLALGEPFRPGDSGIDSDLAKGLDEVVERLGYRQRARSSAQGHKARGMGLGIGIKDGGGTGNHAQALVKLLPSGRAIVSAAAV